MRPIRRPVPSVEVGPGLNPIEAEVRFQHLLRAHANVLRGFLSRWTAGDRQTTDSLVEATLKRAAMTLGPVGAEATERPWLFTLARRAAIDFNRSRPAPDSTARPARGHGPAGPYLDPRVKPALSRIPADDRAVIVELFYRGRSVEETAALLDIEASVVKSRANRALRALRGALATEPAGGAEG